MKRIRKAFNSLFMFQKNVSVPSVQPNSSGKYCCELTKLGSFHDMTKKIINIINCFYTHDHTLPVYAEITSKIWTICLFLCCHLDRR